jgi:hypothetical protein
MMPAAQSLYGSVEAAGRRQCERAEDLKAGMRKIMRLQTPKQFRRNENETN